MRTGLRLGDEPCASNEPLARGSAGKSRFFAPLRMTSLIEWRSAEGGRCVPAMTLRYGDFSVLRGEEGEDHGNDPTPTPRGRLTNPHVIAVHSSKRHVACYALSRFRWDCGYCLRFGGTGIHTRYAGRS